MSAAERQTEWQRARIEALPLVHNKTGGRCFYCGVTVGGRLHVDHFVPFSRGGSDALDNLVPSCRSCNSEKRDRLLEEWRVFRRYRAAREVSGVPSFTKEQVDWLAERGIDPFEGTDAPAFWFEGEGISAPPDAVSDLVHSVREAIASDGQTPPDDLQLPPRIQTVAHYNDVKVRLRDRWSSSSVFRCPDDRRSALKRARLYLGSVGVMSFLSSFVWLTDQPFPCGPIRRRKGYDEVLL